MSYEGDGFEDVSWTDKQDAVAEKEFVAERVKAIAEAQRLEAENEKYFARGNEGVFERRLELMPELQKRRDEICEQYVEESERMPEALAEQRQDQRFSDVEDMHWAPGVPLWMRLSGLHPRAHLVMNPNERAGRIRLLLRRVERMVRWELRSRKDAKAQSTDGTALKIENCKFQNANLNSDDGGERSVIEETVLWSPVRSISVYLEISQSALSSLCREITGMAIEQVVDRIKAENLREEFKTRLKDFVLGWFANEKKKGAPGRGAPATVADEIFAALKAERRTRFNRTQWAFELGFSSYQRLFRATLLSFGMTPHQLEIAAIEELLPADALCSDGQERTEGGEQKADGGKQKAEGGEGGGEGHNKGERPTEAG